MINLPALDVRDLSKIYTRAGRTPLRAVDGLNLTVNEGECIGLLGPNGAGKSTSMKCITGFYPPTSGSVRIFGIDVHENPKQARLELGVCSQDDTLDTDFDVLDQMVQFATFFGIRAREGRERALALLSRFGLLAKRSELVESLSGGMRRRLQVARGLINKPRLLILDEPTTGLDPEARKILWEVLGEEKQRGLAILLSTHYMEEAERFCDKVAIIHNGKILANDSPANLIMSRGLKNLEEVYLNLTGEK